MIRQMQAVLLAQQAENENRLEVVCKTERLYIVSTPRDARYVIPLDISTAIHIHIELYEIGNEKINKTIAETIYQYLPDLPTDREFVKLKMKIGNQCTIFLRDALYICWSGGVHVMQISELFDIIRFMLQKIKVTLTQDNNQVYFTGSPEV
jgi:hypothetical protein